MSEVTVASTTDSEEDVQLAAGVLPAEGDEPEEEATTEEGEKPSEAEADSEPAKPEDEEEEKPKAKSKSAAASEAAKSEDEPRGKGGFQKRIDKLTEEKYNLRDENRELRERLDRLEVLVKKPEAQVVEETNVKPTRDKFKTDEEFYEALGRFSAQQEIARADAEANQRATNEELAVTFANYNEGVQSFRAENPDFDETVGDTNLKIPMAVQTAIISYEQEGPALAYYLAKNPEVTLRLGKMNDVRAVAEIGRIHAQLYPEVEEQQEDPKPAPPAKKLVTKKAPAPIKPIRASATNTAVPLEELPYADYRRVRDQQERGRIRR